MKDTCRCRGVVTLTATLMRRRRAAQSSSATQIAEAVQILPEDLRAGATVVTYDAATGARKVLRQGTNFIECQPRMADGFTRCYNKALGPRRDLEAKLRAEKKTDEEIQPAIAAAVKAGTLPAPRQGDDVVSRLRQARPHPEPVGDVAAQRDAGIGRRLDRRASATTRSKGKGLPWMMLPGTPGAHIMIPINPPAKTSTITDQAADEITQATLPLPEDLRAGATVYKYDPKTGERITLRKGTNALECTPRGADGFTWCYNQVTAPAPRSRGQAPRARASPTRTSRTRRRGATKAGTHQADAVRHDVVPAATARRIGSSCCGCCRCPARRRSRSACRTAASATRRSAATAGRG